jgi:iron complex outermembrane receptor protein
LGTNAAGSAFKPETGEQYEVGIKYQPKNQNSLVTLAFFDLTRENFLTSDPTTFANVQRGEARSRGIELEGVASFDIGLNLTAGYTYLDAKVTKSSFADEVGEPLEYAPNHKATLWADYTVPSGVAKGWGIGGGARYTGPSFGNSFAARNNIEIPGYVLFDATVHYGWKQFQFAVNLQNMLDKEYVATAFTSGGDFATFGSRRVVTGSIKYSF